MHRYVIFLLVTALVGREAAAQRASVLLVTGRTMTPIGGTASVYNSTHETSFSTQLINSFPNGISYWWSQSKGTFDMGMDAAGTRYQVLLRFDEAHKYVPPGATVESAELSVTFINWNGWVAVQACFMTVPWSYNESDAQRFTSTGWLYSRWNGTRSVPWSQPGGWADCDPGATISFVVRSGDRNGNWIMTVPLEPKRVAAWLANNGSRNYGLLFRGINGTLPLSFVTSKYVNGTLYRPALTVNYYLPPASTRSPPPSPPPGSVNLPLVNLTAVPRTWWVGPAGNDELNSGHQLLPLKSIAKALTLAWPGDTINLFSGNYGGSLSIYRAGLTIQSAPGHWAVISSPISDPRTSVNVITIFPGADNGTLANLEITGGYYYGIMFYTDWGSYGSSTEANMAYARAPSNWRLTNVRIHDTGSSNVKLSVKANNNSFSNCEFFNAGQRLRTYGYGLEVVHVYDLSIVDCYFHDILGAAAVLLAGGTARAVIERNYIERADRGLELGGITDGSIMNSIQNPDLYECINVTARNNIVSTTRMAGIVLRSAWRTVVAHNTLWNVMESGQSGILFDAAYHSIPSRGPGNTATPCSGIVVYGNLVVISSTAVAGPLVQIRLVGLLDDSLNRTTFNSSSPGYINSTATTTPLTSLPGLSMAYNVYYDAAGLGPTNGSFFWGTGAMLEDQRTTSGFGNRLAFVGNTTGWAAHCTVTMAQPFCDVNSTEADPRLDGTFTPLPCSPARGRAAAATPSGEVYVTDDFYGRPRPAGGASRDAGAVQSPVNATAATKALPKPIPPLPSAMAKRLPYTGKGLDPVYDFSWPYYFWVPRICKDIIVDMVKGDDSQPFDYYSNYAQPFRTLGVALTRHNQCDRILLRGGQNHTGVVTITQTNLTLTTHPDDLKAGKRAVVQCIGTGNATCILMYGGATALTLSSFDVVMNGSATTGSCIHMNEGAGSGTSPYWSFYVTNSKKVGPKVTTFKDMSLVSCGVHGIKLSTFVRYVTLDGLRISDPQVVGVNVVGGTDVTVRSCRVTNPGEAGIRMGGAVRNVLIERNLIKNYGGVGIMLGSEGMLASYTDVDWARTPPEDWHECINAVVRNNVVDGGAGAGIAFYSARDAVVVHNTFLRVAATMHAAVLLNVSPKQTGPAAEAGPPNTNITFRNNIATMPAESKLKFMVQTRMLQGAVTVRQLNISRPNATSCSSSSSSSSSGRRRELSGGEGQSDGSSSSEAGHGAWGGSGGGSAGRLRGPGGSGGQLHGPGGSSGDGSQVARPWDDAVPAVSTDSAGYYDMYYDMSGHVAAAAAAAAGGFATATPARGGRSPHRTAAAAADADVTNDDSVVAADGVYDAATTTTTVPSSSSSSYLPTADPTLFNPFDTDGSGGGAGVVTVPTSSLSAAARRRLLSSTPASFALPYLNDPREQGRNSDGSCPIFPDSNSWHQDVSGLAVHPRSEAIKSNIGLHNLMVDFGFKVNINGTVFPAGMPITVVDSGKGTPRLNFTFGPSGYGDPSMLEPGGLPIPADTPVQGSFPGCGDPPCWGDRHLIVIDNATCTLYEAWRAFPPSVTGTGAWQVEAILRFNLSRNALSLQLGATSADAAGLPIMPGLARFEETVVKGYINHALRFTGPNSRPAYALPAEHYAPAGYTGRDAPYMGMRVRLKASYNCSALARTAAVFCRALQKYGAFFADNGLPWDFAGEGSDQWYPYWPELAEVGKIPSSEMEVIDPGCMCVDSGCTVAECNGMAWVDPDAPPVYPAIVDPTASTLNFNNNFYFKVDPRNTSAYQDVGPIYVDQRVPPFGAGYSGDLAGWGSYLGGGNEAGSVEKDPGIDPVTYRPISASAVRCAVPRLAAAVAGTTDFYGRARGVGTGCAADAGAAMA